MVTDTNIVHRHNKSRHSTAKLIKLIFKTRFSLVPPSTCTSQCTYVDGVELGTLILFMPSSKANYFSPRQVRDAAHAAPPPPPPPHRCKVFRRRRRYRDVCANVHTLPSPRARSHIRTNRQARFAVCITQFFSRRITHYVIHERLDASPIWLVYR